MNAIYEIRKASGLSQAAFAKLLDITQPAISQYENGHVLPSGVQAVRLVALAKKFKLRLKFEDLYKTQVTADT